MNRRTFLNAALSSVPAGVMGNPQSDVRATKAVHVARRPRPSRRGPGDCVLAPRKVPHTWASLSDGPAKLMVAFQPAGRMEAFFREVGKIAAPPSPEQMQRLFRDHGMEIVGQPLSIEP